MAINQFLEKYLHDAGGVFPDRGGFNFPRGMNAEYYYQELLKLYEQQLKNLESIKENLKAAGIDGLDDHSGWEGQSEEPEEQESSKPAQTASAKEIEEHLEKIRQSAGMEEPEDKKLSDGVRSESPGKVVFRWDVPPKKIPAWLNKTRNLAIHGFTTEMRSTRKKPNRRFGTTYPATRKQIVGNRALVAVDVSGSIDMNLFENFVKHLRELSKHCEFDVLVFDDKIISRFRYNKSQYVTPSGGSTNFEPVMKVWNQEYSQYDGLFIFTDGYANYTSTPKNQKSVNWILYGTSAYIRHGNVYNMEIV